VHRLRGEQPGRDGIGLRLDQLGVEGDVVLVGRDSRVVGFPTGTGVDERDDGLDSTVLVDQPHEGRGTDPAPQLAVARSLSS
jgi:hypothetical protein